MAAIMRTKYLVNQAVNFGIKWADSEEICSLNGRVRRKPETVSRAEQALFQR